MTGRGVGDRRLGVVAVVPDAVETPLAVDGSSHRPHSHEGAAVSLGCLLVHQQTDRPPRSLAGRASCCSLAGWAHPEPAWLRPPRTLGVVGVPPAENKPALQDMQLEPPVPGAHGCASGAGCKRAAGAGYIRRCRNGRKRGKGGLELVC